MPLASLSTPATTHGAWTRLVTYLTVWPAPQTQPAAPAILATGWPRTFHPVLTPRAQLITVLTATGQTVADAKTDTVSAQTHQPALLSAKTPTASPVRLPLPVPPVRQAFYSTSPLNYAPLFVIFQTVQAA